jgi:acetylornithine deacetylase/succinyl-diaminopimelate desuccinylase-like protein
MRPAIDVLRLHETLAHCIRTPSPQTDMEAVRSFIVNVVRPHLEDLPFARLTVDDMGNLVGVLAGQERAAPFMLCTYAGTVPAGQMPEPFVPSVVDGELFGQPRGPHMWGRGTSEQMGALAAALEAIRVFCEEAPKLRRDVLFAATVAGEMGCHDAVDHMMQAGSFNYGPTLLAVGTNNTVYAGSMGRIDVHVEIMGRACHSSNPALGRNAIEGARQFLNALQGVPLPAPDPDLGQPSLTPTLIASSPSISHTVPDRCRLVLDRRLIPGENMERALADIVECGEQVSGLEVKVEGGRFNYPSKTARDAPLIQAALAAVRAEGIAPVCRHARWTLDAGFFTRQGVDAILLGPGDEKMAHTDAEMVALSDVELAARTYVRILRAMVSEVH